MVLERNPGIYKEWNAMTDRHKKFSDFFHEMATQSDWNVIMSQCKLLFQVNFEILPLKECPNLKAMAERLYKWLNTYKVHATCVDRTLYDLLMECICTDIIMSALQRYDIRRRVIQNYYDNIEPSLQKYLIWLNNGNVGQTSALVRDIPREYYCLQENGGGENFLYSSLDKNFLQILVFLRKYQIRDSRFKFLLHPSSIISLISDQPCFAYCLEKHGKFYSEYTDNTVDYNMDIWNEWIDEAFFTKEKASDVLGIRKQQRKFKEKADQIRLEQKKIFKIAPNTFTEEEYQQIQLHQQLSTADFDLYRRRLRLLDETKINEITQEIQEGLLKLHTDNSGIDLIKSIRHLLKLDTPIRTDEEDTYCLPYQLANSPCVRMFCKKIQADIWENECNTASAEITDADFYIGFSVIIKLIAEEYTFWEDQLKIYIDIPYLQESTDRPQQLVWPWAEKLIPDKKENNTSKVDYSGQHIPFLSKLMNWFYDDNCLSEWIETCQWVKYERENRSLTTFFSDISQMADALEVLNTQFSSIQGVFTSSVIDITSMICTKNEEIIDLYNHYYEKDPSNRTNPEELSEMRSELNLLYHVLQDANNTIYDPIISLGETLKKYIDIIEYIQSLPNPATLKEGNEEQFSKTQSNDLESFGWNSINERLYNAILSIPEWLPTTPMKSSRASNHTIKEIMQVGKRFWKQLQKVDSKRYSALRKQYDDFLSTTFGIKNKAKQRN